MSYNNRKHGSNHAKIRENIGFEAKKMIESTQTHPSLLHLEELASLSKKTI